MMFMKLEAEFVPAWPESIFPFWCEKIAGSSKKTQHSQNSIFCRTHVRNATIINKDSTTGAKRTLSFTDMDPPGFDVW